MTKQHKETSKTIKNLMQNAKKGNLLSMFQLYENYSSGKYVEEKTKSLLNNILMGFRKNYLKQSLQLNHLTSMNLDVLES